MLIRHLRANDPKPSEITSRHAYLNRRAFMAAGGAVLAGAALPAAGAASRRLDFATTPHGAGLEVSDREDATTYNNFYEFALDKDGPAAESKAFRPRPWSVRIGGACHRPGDLSFEDLIRPHRLEERIYRFRCVEAWSMVVPWVGVPLGDLLKRFEPMGSARYVAFRTLFDPEVMPMQKTGVLEWPYREGLRMDEAMHPLTLMVVGMYGEVLPNQNGAPLRLIVPWKYGFKCIKSIVSIDFAEEMPRTTWSTANPREYGFYANVDPEVDHPRWSQARERRLGDGLFTPKRDTLYLNGYADRVAHLYAGMDRNKLF